MRRIADAGEAESRRLLKEMTRKKIHYLLGKHAIRDIDVYSVVKEFFQEYLQAKYEFTFDELQEELRKIYLEKYAKDQLFLLIDRFSTVEYQDEEIPQEVLQSILKNFDVLLDHLIKVEPKKSFLGKLLGKNTPLVEPRPVEPLAHAPVLPVEPRPVEVKKIPDVKPLTKKPEKLVKSTPEKLIEKPDWSDDARGKVDEVSNWTDEWDFHHDASVMVKSRDDALRDAIVEEKFRESVFAQDEVPEPPSEEVMNSVWDAASGVAPKSVPPFDAPTENPVQSVPPQDVPRSKNQGAIKDSKPATVKESKPEVSLPKDSAPAVIPKDSSTVKSKDVPVAKAVTPSDGKGKMLPSSPALKQIPDEKKKLVSVHNDDLLELSSQLDSIITPTVSTVSELILDVKVALSAQDKVRSQKAYKDLLAAYNGLSESEKSKYFKQINALYKEMK